MDISDVSTEEDTFPRWAKRNSRRAQSCEKGSEIYNNPRDHLQLPRQLSYYKTFHSDSSLASSGVESKSQSRKSRATFKGVTIFEPKSPKKQTHDRSSSFKSFSRSKYYSFEPSEVVHRLDSDLPGEHCDIVSPTEVLYRNRRDRDEDATNLFGLRRDSIFQSDSQLISNQQPSSLKDTSVKMSTKLKKSFSVRFLHRSPKAVCDRNQIQSLKSSPYSDHRKRKWPSTQIFRRPFGTSQKSESSERNIFKWQKRKRKEEDNKSRNVSDNWQKLIAYSRQLSEGNRALQQERGHEVHHPKYDSLSSKRGPVLHETNLNDELLTNKSSRTVLCSSILRNKSELETGRADRIGGSKKGFYKSSSLQEEDEVHFKRTSSIQKNIKSLKNPSLRKFAGREDELPLTPDVSSSCRKRSKRQWSSKEDKSKVERSAGHWVTEQNLSGVRHNDSKNSMESFVTAICQSLTSIEEERDSTAVDGATVARSRSFKRSKTQTCTETKRSNKMADERKVGRMESLTSRRSRSDSTKKKKGSQKIKAENYNNIQTVLGRSLSNDDGQKSAGVRIQPTSYSIDCEPPYISHFVPKQCPIHETDESNLNNDDDCSKVTVPIYICLILIGGYLFAGSALFAHWEGWNTITGSYFCFITLSTIGFGDIVPGTRAKDWSSQAKLVLCTLWLALGLSLLAMCFNLMQEEVKEKCRLAGVKLGLLKDD